MQIEVGIAGFHQQSVRCESTAITTTNQPNCPYYPLNAFSIHSIGTPICSELCALGAEDYKDPSVVVTGRNTRLGLISSIDTTMIFDANLSHSELQKINWLEVQVR